MYIANGHIEDLCFHDTNTTTKAVQFILCVDDPKICAQEDAPYTGVSWDAVRDPTLKNFD